MKDIYIIATKRTPFGKYNGQLKDFDAVELGEIALTAAIEAAGIKPTEVDSLLLGNVISANLGQNAARQIALRSGMSEQSTALVVNQVCGSSLKALRIAEGLMNMGDASIVAVGGSESMTNAPMMQKRVVDEGADNPLVNSMLRDGLMDPLSGQHMGITAENVAVKYHISRLEQDKFAFESHQKAYAATANDWYENELIKFEHDGQKVEQDQNIRPDTNLDKLASLKPAFKPDGIVTAGNSAPLSDGASMMILATAEKVAELGLKPIAKITGYAEIGTDPALMGYAPYYAITKLLGSTKTTIADYDLFEINEAFAAQAVAVQRDLNVPMKKLNIAGGALAIGHPLGATGSRLIGALINNLKQTAQKKGIASLCIGGGMGIAYAIEVVDYE